DLEGALNRLANGVADMGAEKLGHALTQSVGEVFQGLAQPFQALRQEAPNRAGEDGDGHGRILLSGWVKVGEGLNGGGNVRTARRPGSPRRRSSSPSSRGASG